MNKIDRRTFVQRTGLAGISLLTATLAASRVTADPDPPASAKGPGPMGNSPEPEIYPFRLGGVDAFVVHDGTLAVDHPQAMLAPEAKPSEIEEALRQNFLPPHRLALSVNVLVLKGKAGVTLFDCGAGTAFGPGFGKLLRGLAKLGLSPDDVKTVYVTHAHADHIGGLVDAANRPVFGSAKVVAAKAEVDFWMSDAPDLSGMKTPAETKAQTAATIKKFLGGAKTELDLKQPGQVSEQVEMVAAPGHTPGHSLFSVTEGDEKILVIGDAVHSYALQFAHPEWSMVYDVNPAQAIATRKKLFTDAAAERTTILAYHLPFPGIGHIRAQGRGYEWVPRPWVS